MDLTEALHCQNEESAEGQIEVLEKTVFYDVEFADFRNKNSVVGCERLDPLKEIIDGVDEQN